MAGQTIAPTCLNALPAKPRFFSTHHETEQQKEKQQEPEHVCAHGHSSPTLHLSRVQQAHSNFLSSLDEAAKTCFASTAALALPALLWAAGLSFRPPNLTCGCLTCFQQLQGSLYIGRMLHSTSEPAFLTPFRPDQGVTAPWPGIQASEAEIHSLERMRSVWQGEDSAPAEVALSHAAPLAMGPCRDALGSP